MYALEHGRSDGGWEPRDRQQFLSRCVAKCGETSELVEETGPAFRTETVDAVEHPGNHPFSPKRAVVRHGEAVCFVAESLQEIQAFRLPGKSDRVGTAWEVDLFETLGQRRNREPLGEPEALEHPDPHVELSQSAIE